MSSLSGNLQRFGVEGQEAKSLQEIIAETTDTLRSLSAPLRWISQPSSSRFTIRRDQKLLSYVQIMRVF